MVVVSLIENMEDCDVWDCEEQEEVFTSVTVPDCRPFEVVLRGGAPWEFDLQGADGQGDSPLRVSRVEENSRAEEGGVKEGDLVLSVNGISCGSCQLAQQLIDTAFRTLTLRLFRGSSDVSRGARPPSSSLQQRRNSVTSSRPISTSSPWRHAANDDSAVYRRSKGGLSNIMRASRPQRGESFSVGKSRPPARPRAAGAPPWPQSSASPSTPHHAPATTPTSLTAPSSSSPAITHPAPALSSKASDSNTSLHDAHLASDRHRHRDSRNRASSRQSEKDTNHLNTDWNRGWDSLEQGDRQQDRKQTQDGSVHIHSRPHPMVSSKSSPNLLNKGDPAVPVAWRSPATPDRSVSRSVSSILDDLPGEGDSRRPSVLEQQAGEHGATPRGVDGARDRVREAGKQTSHQHTSSNRHDQLHRRASGMNIPREAQCAVSHSAPNCKYQPVTSNHQPGYKPSQGYQPDLHSLQKNQPQNSVLTSRPNSYSVPNYNPDSRVQNYSTDTKAVPASHADYGNRGRDSRCVAVNSVPGSQTYENVTLLASASLRKEHRVGEESKGRDGLSLPSRPYSSVSDDGHGSGVPNPSQHDLSSLQYNKVPRSQEKCPPWPQNPSVGVQSRSPACSDPGGTPREMSTAQSGPRPSLDNSLGLQRSLPENMKARPEDFRQTSLPGYLPPGMDPGGGGVADKGYSASCASARDVDGVGRQLLSQRLNPGLTPTPQSIQTHSQRCVPGSFPPPSMPGDTEREDKSTSPLASPRYALPSPGDKPSPSSRSPSPRDRPHKDFAVASTKQNSSSAPGAGKAPSKGVIVRSTPYYNTSTQTELSAYALKTSDPRGVPQCSVQIQVDEADKQCPPRRGVEEKSIQARMSREFQPSELDATSHHARKSPDQTTHPDLTGARKAQCDEKIYFQFPFEGMKSIQEKYGVGEEVAGSRQDSSMFSCVETGDQASIMRQLSEEFYRGSRGAGAGDKPHLPGSNLDQVSRPLSSSSLSSQLSSSQPSVADPHHDPSATSRSSLRPGGPHQQDHVSRSSPRPLQESKKFKSLSAISHQREASVPVTGRSLAQSHESLSPDTLNASARRPPSESGRDSGGMFQPPSPSPRNSCSESGSHKPPKGGAFPPSSGASGGSGTVSASRHARTHSMDSVLSDRPTGSQRDRTRGDNSSGSDGVKKTNGDKVGRKPSMKMAYGIYEDSDILSLSKDSHTASDPAERSKVSAADAVQLGQIREEGGSSLTSGFKPQRPGELTRHKTQGDISDPTQDSWRDDLNKRTGLFQNRASSELILTPRDRSAKMSESFSSHRPPRLFDGSIDSGVGSEISCRVDGVVTPSETPRSPLLPLDNPTGLELKQIQQQAVLNFLQRKTGIPFHSPEPSVCDSTTSTPRVSQSQSQAPDPVSALISKTNANLARRADSLRRTSSVSSRASSAEQVEVSRSRKETEWSRLRSSGSFNYGSDRSSLCSDNTYEDISVFAPATPRGSLVDTAKAAEDTQNLVTHAASQDNQRSNTDSGVMASTTAYQNIPGPPPRRRPPPPPPRSPSPEPGPPPALPPRNYGPRKEEGAPGEGEVKVDESKVDFKAVLQQCRDKLSPREDAYTAQLRKLDVKFSGLRGGSSPSTPPTSMSVLHSRTPTGISTSYKRQPTMAQEATTPGITTVTSSISLTPSVSSSASSLGARASSPHHLSQDLHSESHLSVSLSSQTKDSPSEPPPPVKVVVDRDTKPMTAPVISAKPPQLPERAAPPPPREQKPASSARADLLPPRSEGALPKDRTVPDFHAKVSNWKFLPPPEVPRDRKLVDSHVLPGKTDSGSASPSKDSSRSPAGKRRDVPPPPSPGKDDHDGVGVVDLAHLPPPPPELLSDSGGHFGKGEPEKTEPFADDSYGAYKNRGSRQVGTYKRSSSAALLRPDNQHLKAATDAHAVFGDRRLGNQAWNSDTQLQASRRADAQQPDGGGAPQRPPDRAGNPPAEGGPARSVGRVSGVVSSASGGRGRDDGKVFTAHPFRVESRAIPEKEVVNSYDSGQPSRLLKETTEKTVTSSSLNAGQTAGTPNSSSGQRWANAIPFPTTHRVTSDDVKPVSAGPSSPHNHRGPPPRPGVTPATDYQQSRDRTSGSAPANSTHNPTAPPRSRVLSDRSRHGDVSPTPDSRQRYAEVAPFASEARAMPGHVRTVSQSSDPPRPAPSPYSRRESAPPPHIPPEAIAMVSPRRKSEDLLTDKESCVADEQVLISHGRQPSQEELECDQRAKELAMEVADSEKKLSDVLNADNSKKRMEYMDGLFSVPVEVDVKIQASVRRHQSHSAGDMPSFRPQPLHSASRSVDEEQLKKRPLLPLKHSLSSPGGVVVERAEEECSDSDRNAQDNDAIVKHKEEVMEKLQKKLELLKEEKKGLQEEIDGNKALGKRLSEAVDSKCSNPSERDKFHTYISDLEKIVRLLLNLSGQLARAENAVQALGDDTNPDQKKRAVEKCEGLRTKYLEAKQLKDHMDKRSDTVSAILRQSLSGQELKDYSHFISLTSTLTIHLQQLEDEITLGQEQILQLRKSMSEQPTPSSPLSPSPVPVSS